MRVAKLMTTRWWQSLLKFWLFSASPNNQNNGKVDIGDVVEVNKYQLPMMICRIRQKTLKLACHVWFGIYILILSLLATLSQYQWVQWYSNKIWILGLNKFWSIESILKFHWLLGRRGSHEFHQKFLSSQIILFFFNKGNLNSTSVIYGGIIICISSHLCFFNSHWPQSPSKTDPKSKITNHQSITGLWCVHLGLNDGIRWCFESLVNSNEQRIRFHYSDDDVVTPEIPPPYGSVASSGHRCCAPQTAESCAPKDGGPVRSSSKAEERYTFDRLAKKNTSLRKKN